MRETKQSAKEPLLTWRPMRVAAGQPGLSELFTESVTSARQLFRIARSGSTLADINSIRRNSRPIRGLLRRLFFRQIDAAQADKDFSGSCTGFFNKLIHSFRGYRLDDLNYVGITTS